MLERIHQLVKHATYPPESVIQLLEQTCIGTKGTLYQLLDTRQKIKRLHSPHFIYLERNEKAIGTVTLCERDVHLNGLQTPTVYIRYFAFDQLFQGSSNQSRGRSSFHSYFKASLTRVISTRFSLKGTSNCTGRLLIRKMRVHLI